MKLKHWKKQLDDCRGNPTPERNARAKLVAASDKPFSIHPDEAEADRYVNSVRRTSDYEDVEAWHGWALNEAFLAGMSAERDQVRIQSVIDAYVHAKDDEARAAAHEGINALVKERGELMRHNFNCVKADRIDSLLRAAGFSLDDGDWREGTWWWFKDRSAATMVLRSKNVQEAA